jgi:hypothetical protein
MNVLAVRRLCSLPRLGGAAPDELGGFLTKSDGFCRLLIQPEEDFVVYGLEGIRTVATLRLAGRPYANPPDPGAEIVILASRREPARYPRCTEERWEYYFVLALPSCRAAEARALMKSFLPPGWRYVDHAITFMKLVDTMAAPLGLELSPDDGLRQ